MATVTAVVLNANKKKDSTLNVLIRLWHQDKARYIPTEHWVSPKQVKANGSVKDPIINQMLNPTLDGYRVKIGELGTRVKQFDPDSLVKYLQADLQKLTPDDINVIEFGRNQIEELKKQKRDGSAGNMLTVVNSLEDYFKSPFVPISEITSNMLRAYEKYLTRPRTLSRQTCPGEKVKYQKEGLTESGVHNHMRDLRILFNNIREHYNDEEKGICIIAHYPFKKYKVKEAPAKVKRKLTIDEVKKIRDFEAPEGSRMELARDLFMLSLYLCGMNAKDMYEMDAECIQGSRIDYNRAKTRNRRKDKAFISIKIPTEARPLLIKYAGKLQQRYSTHNALDRALSIGITKIGTDLKIEDMEFYDARHAFGDWARNKCRFSKDDVALAMNHKDNTNKVTDIYISKDWSIVDEVQNGVLNLLKKKADLKKIHKLKVTATKQVA